MNHLELPNKVAMIILCIPATLIWGPWVFKTSLDLFRAGASTKAFLFLPVIVFIFGYLIEWLLVYFAYSSLFPSWLGAALIICSILATVAPLFLAWLVFRLKK